jgi:hypothetical protein
MSDDAPRPCWQNCSETDDDEVHLIDAMEDALGPLDEPTIQVRRLITLFEACYHEADQEAEFIAQAIGAGRSPPRSNERPPQRRRELESARDILSAWCRNPAIRSLDRDMGGIPARKLLHFLGEPNPLKIWQVERVADRVSHALDPKHPYHNLVLNVGPYGEPGPGDVGEPYEDDSIFLRQTRETILHDTVDGRDSRVSLAYAIDLLMPCGWDFAGSLATILKAIGGDVHPQQPMACCARNLRLSPLYNRLWMVSNTLNASWKGQTAGGDIDRRILTSLGASTPVKRWLAASLDKTIRLHLTQPFDLELV